MRARGQRQWSKSAAYSGASGSSGLGGRAPVIAAALRLVLSSGCGEIHRFRRRRPADEPSQCYHYRSGIGRGGDQFARGNSVRTPSPPSPGSAKAAPHVLGILCGVGAALCWAAGFVAARYGIAVGFSPADIVLHRFIWAGLVFLPFVARQGFGDIAGVGWTKAAALTLLGGPALLC